MAPVAPGFAAGRYRLLVRHGFVRSNSVCCAETARPGGVAAIEGPVESLAETESRPGFSQFVAVAKIWCGATGGKKNREPESGGPGETAQESPAKRSPAGIL